MVGRARLRVRVAVLARAHAGGRAGRAERVVDPVGVFLAPPGELARALPVRLPPEVDIPDLGELPEEPRAGQASLRGHVGAR